MDTELFYAELPILGNLLAITHPETFQSAPSDWYIVITDIVNSSNAIAAGRYKDVNLLGASAIIAILNLAGKLEIPFVFGGDGATLLIPPSLFVKSKQALLALRQLAKSEFNLDLRVGMVPVAEVMQTNYEVKVAKIRISQQYYQAVFIGDGLTYATQLIKNPVTANLYTYKTATGNETVDLTGLECRWQDIPSRQGEIVSLIVRATSGVSDTDNKIYQEVIQQIQLIYGREGDLNPITQDHLNLSFDYKTLKPEAKLRAKSTQKWHQYLYLGQILLENCLGWWLMSRKIKWADVDWGVYQATILPATDYQKFDDMLRMVIAGNESQRKALTHYLDENYRQGKLVYGLHRSDRALMTCLVLERNGRHVHFVDGAQGGYTAAATAMKRRINRSRGTKLTSTAWRRSTGLVL